MLDRHLRLVILLIQAVLGPASMAVTWLKLVDDMANDRPSLYCTLHAARAYAYIGEHDDSFS
jgi:hypothetical protein